MFKKILVPLDGSRLSSRSLPYAIELARRFGSEILLMRVVLPPPIRVGAAAVAAPPPMLPAGDPLVAQADSGQSEIVQERSTRQARRYLNGQRRDLEALDINASIRVEVGEPTESIISTCDEEEIDLVVMATRGRGGLKRAVLGSVTDKVVREPGTPVLVIRP
jgi:nucleotide-binding universal stress UspA family protein